MVTRLRQIPRAKEVVTHHVDPIEILVIKLRFGVRDLVEPSADRHRQEILAIRRTTVLLRSRIEFLADFRKQQREISLVFWSRNVRLKPATAGILPVDVDAVEAVLTNE